MKAVECPARRFPLQGTAQPKALQCTCNVASPRIQGSSCSEIHFLLTRLLPTSPHPPDARDALVACGAGTGGSKWIVGEPSILQSWKAVERIHCSPVGQAVATQQQGAERGEACRRAGGSGQRMGSHSRWVVKACTP